MVVLKEDSVDSRRALFRTCLFSFELRLQVPSKVYEEVVSEVFGVTNIKVQRLSAISEQLVDIIK